MIASYIYTGLNVPTQKQYIRSLFSTQEIKGEWIMETVCKYFKLDIKDVISQCRKRELTVCRQICMFYIKKMTKLSLKSIGAMFDGRDHSTVIYAIQTIEDLMDTDKKFTATVNQVEEILHNYKRHSLPELDYLPTIKDMAGAF